MDLLLAAILLAAQDPTAAAPAQDPQAAWTAWWKTLPAAHPRPMTQEVAFDFELAFEELEGDEETLGYFQALLPNMDFDLRMKMEILDATRHRVSLAGSMGIELEGEDAESIALSGAAVLQFDGTRVHGWVDGKETVNELALRAGFSISQAAVDEIYGSVIQGLPEIMAALPAEEFPFDPQELLKVMPPTVADYLHPRGYFASSLHFLEASRYEADEERVRTTLRPSAAFRAAITKSMAAEMEGADLDAEQAMKLAQSFLESMHMEATLDRATGVPLDYEFSLSIPLEALETDLEISGRMVMRLTARTTAFSLTAPAAERFALPEDIEWFDVDDLLPMIRMQLDALLAGPDPSEDDYEF